MDDSGLWRKLDELENKVRALESLAGVLLVGRKVRAGMQYQWLSKTCMGGEGVVRKSEQGELTIETENGFIKRLATEVEIL